MKVKYGAMVAMLSGAWGNVVASKNKYGAYFRSRVVPTKVSNDNTNDVRNRFSGLSKNWAALALADKEAWRTWAATNPIIDRLGDSRVLQPSAAFIQLNARILQAGGSQIDVPPLVASPAPISGLAVVADASDSTVGVSWTSGALAAGQCLAIWVAVIDSPGRSYYKNMLKLVLITAAEATTPQAAGASVEARFGSLIEGQTLHVECEVWDSVTGLISGREYVKATVAA